MTSRSMIATVALLALLVSGSLMANGIPYCAEGTLADYIALPQGCIIDDKVFSNWAYTSSGWNGGNPPPASGVSVVPITTPFNPGFLFSAGWFVTGGQVIDSHIIYTVTVLPGGAPIHDLALYMGGDARLGEAGISVAETTNPDVGSLSIYNLPQLGRKGSDHILITPTMGPIQVDKNIFLFSSQGSYATVSGVYNRFSEVPEPVTLVLIGSGLLGLGLLRRRSRSA